MLKENDYKFSFRRRGSFIHERTLFSSQQKILLLKIVLSFVFPRHGSLFCLRSKIQEDKNRIWKREQEIDQRMESEVSSLRDYLKTEHEAEVIESHFLYSTANMMRLLRKVLVLSIFLCVSCIISMLLSQVQALKEDHQSAMKSSIEQARTNFERDFELKLVCLCVLFLIYCFCGGEEFQVQTCSDEHSQIWRKSKME